MLIFFLARQQYPASFSPTPSNCNLQARPGFFVDPKSLVEIRSSTFNERPVPQRRREKTTQRKPLCVSASRRLCGKNRPIIKKQTRPTPPPLITAPRDVVKQEFHNAITKAHPRRDAETRRKTHTTKTSLRLSVSAGKSPRSSASDRAPPRHAETGTARRSNES